MHRRQRERNQTLSILTTTKPQRWIAREEEKNKECTKQTGNKTEW